MAEEVSFLGPTVLPEIKKALPLLPTYDKTTLQALVNLSIAYLKGEDVTAASFEDLSPSIRTVPDKFNAVAAFTGLFFLFRSGIRSRIKFTAFKAGLDELRVPAEASTLLVNTFKACKEELEAELAKQTLHYPSLEQLRWRVDVAISTSSMSFVLKPAVLMKLSLSDGSIIMFEVSPLRFHQLRYNVSKVLKEMQDLEKLAILKLDK